VALKAWDSVLVEFDSGRIVPRYIRLKICYGVGLYYRHLHLRNEKHLFSASVLKEAIG